MRKFRPKTFFNYGSNPGGAMQGYKLDMSEILSNSAHTLNRTLRSLLVIVIDQVEFFAKSRIFKNSKSNDFFFCPFTGRLTRDRIAPTCLGRGTP